MAEPTTTAAGAMSLTVVSVALFGPLAGPYVLIVFAALAGALWPLSAAQTETRWQGFCLLLRCTLTAVVLTGVLAQLLEQQFQVPVNNGIGVVAHLIGALGNGWRPVFSALQDILVAAIGRKAKESNNG